MSIQSIVFDLGGVLIDWNPEYLYRKIFNTEEEVQYFLAEIATSDWNEQQDAGRSLAEGTRTLVEMHPEFKAEIEAFYSRWSEMLGGPIESTVETLKALKASELYNIYALTNWSEETFPIALERYDFLKLFDGIVVSGIEKCKKPEALIYMILFARYDIRPSEALFIDDNLRNIKAAEEIGFKTIHYQDSMQLKNELANFLSYSL